MCSILRNRYPVIGLKTSYGNCSIYNNDILPLLARESIPTYKLITLIIKHYLLKNLDKLGSITQKSRNFVRTNLAVLKLCTKSGQKAHTIT